VLDGVTGFDWDVHNVGHVARHGVHPVEVEEAVEQAHLIIPAKDMRGEKRWKLFGRSAAGPVTAHTMNERERRIYAPEIDKTL
jgi:uncharacterized DUF497 family protein